MTGEGELEMGGKRRGGGRGEETRGGVGGKNGIGEEGGMGGGTGGKEKWGRG